MFYYIYETCLCQLLFPQFFLTGFIGELITRNSPERNNYLIAEEF